VLALGREHSCVIERDGAVACWGRGDHGELGDGKFRDTAPLGAASPVVVSRLGSVAELAAGQYHVCALRSDDHRVLCWGGAFNGQLGDGDVHDGEPGVAVPTEMDLTDVVHLAAGGGDHTCALMGDHTVRCWGDNLFGQLGNDTRDDSAVPVAVKGLTAVAQVAAGTFQSCALLEDRTVKCWGSGGADLTTGQGITNPVPVPIVGLAEVTRIVAGGDFSCALLATGHVECWGEGDTGQLGDGKRNDSNLTPVDVQGLDDAVQLSAGRSHACALRRDRSLVCWGDGEFGQLGDRIFHNGFPTDVSIPTPATAFTDVTEVSCGGAHTCVRTSTSTVECVGRGQHGELGDGEIYDDPPGSLVAVKTLVSIR
jgi:alpha-tubulin suppressor-like RCC1 family protein